MSAIKDIGRSLLSNPSGPYNAKAVQPLPVASSPGIFAETNNTRLARASWRRHLEAYGGAEAIDYVMDCADLIASTAASANYHFEKGGSTLISERTDKTPAYVREAPQDLVRLIRYPNPWQDWDEFISLTMIDYLICGNSFWLKDGATSDPEGKPAALYRLDPKQMIVFAGDKKMIDHYEYEVAGQSQPIKYAPEQIVHFRRPNPHSDQVGLGIIAGGPRVFDTELGMVESMSAYYQNGTRVSGVLESDRTVPTPIMDKIKRQFKGLYSGAKNSYQVPVLERGLKFKANSANAAEAEYRHMMPAIRERIAGMFKTPLPLLGVYDNADRQAVREAQRIFDNKIMVPLLGKIASKISKELTLAWFIDFKFDYEYVMPIEDRMDLAESMATLPGVRVREIREQINLEPLGPDEKGPDGKPIDDYILNLPGSDANDSTVKDRLMGKEGGRPPNPEHTRRLDDNSPANPDAEVITSGA